MVAYFRCVSNSLLLFALMSVLSIQGSKAQTIVPDSDTHTVISHPGGNFDQFDITGGTRSGGNLFHSFQQFGLSQGQIANFLSNPGIQNILGRVTGSNASLINGMIQVSGGNSNLFLMNPSGIIFGPNARLNVPASFTATTANGIGLGNGGWFNATGLNNYANLTGNPDSFAFLGNAGAILNAGVLTANPQQSITLLGGVVVNTGTIAAPGGNITIAAVPGQRLVLITQQGSLLSLALPTETASAINTPTGSPLSLPALLTGGALPEATEINVENGIVKLTSNTRTISTEIGAATVTGSLSTASTTLPNNSHIQVLGDRVSLFNANLNASSINGGTVQIGGDYQGASNLPAARFTEVDADTFIRADAISASTSRTGNGGTVILWSADTTRFAGTITAQAGTNGGNGGLVETSGKQTLIVSPTAHVSTRAPQGQTGTWLLAPPELTIATGGIATLSVTSPLTNTPTTATTISAATIVTGLNGNHVNLQASDLITVNAAIDASANSLTGDLTLTTPTITLNQPIILATGSSLNGTATTVNVNLGGIIQNGVDVAAAGATVNVAAGTFYVPKVTNQVSITKPLTVQGAGAGSTIIDGGGSSRGVYIDSGVENIVKIEGLTIQNGFVAGSSGKGAGILINSGTLNLTNINLSNNSVIDNSIFDFFNPSYGGGIYNAAEGKINLVNSTLTGNSASDGGGIYSNGTLTISNSTITNNLATGYQAVHAGGGIYNTGTLTISNTDFSGNSAFKYFYSGFGGAIYNLGLLTVDSSIFSSNSANLGGGLANYGTTNLNNSVVANNVAASGAHYTGGIGGGIYNSGNMAITNSTIRDNNAVWSGGGIDNSGIIHLTNSTISGNSSNQGGGIAIGSGIVNLTNTTISDNVSYGGGGIYNGSGTVNLTNSTISGNVVKSYDYYLTLTYTFFGGGIYNNGNLQISDSTIANNSAGSGGGIFNAASTDYFPAGTFSVRNSLISGNTASSGREITNLGNARSEGYNLFGFQSSSGVEGMGLASTDVVPRVDIAQIFSPLGNYGGATQTHALVPGSPAINAGTPSLQTSDQRGFARVSRADIGSFEFQGITPVSSSWRLFSLTDLNQITNAFWGQEVESLTIGFQLRSSSILCAVSSQGGKQEPDMYQGIPACSP